MQQNNVVAIDIITKNVNKINQFIDSIWGEYIEKYFAEAKDSERIFGIERSRIIYAK